MVDIDTQKKVTSYSNKITALQAEVAELLEGIDNLKQKVAELLGDGEHTYGDGEHFYKMTSGTGKLYNEAFGKKNAPELWEEFAEPTKVLTSAIAKARLSAEQYALFQKPNSKKTIKIELLEDKA
jgi:hypothetical protein